jgi:hypothetical protein
MKDLLAEEEEAKFKKIVTALDEIAMGCMHALQYQVGPHPITIIRRAIERAWVKGFEYGKAKHE